MTIKFYTRRLRTIPMKVINYVLNVRIAVLNGGLHEERIFGTYPDIDLLYTGKPGLKMLLFKYDIIFIPFHMDEIFLYSLKKLLEKYVLKGGILVILGATKECDRDWIPFCQWNEKYPEQRLKPFKRETEDERRIFAEIESVENLKYHGTYYSHGTLVPTTKNADKNPEKLVVDENNLTVMLVMRSGFKGTFFATTLDPDFHSVVQVPGRTQEKFDKTREDAQRLLNNIYEWTKFESKKRGEWDRLFWRFNWLIKKSWFCFKSFSIIIIPSIFGTVLTYYLALDKKSLLDLFPSIIGYVSSLASISSYLQQNNMDKKTSS